MPLVTVLRLLMLADNVAILVVCPSIVDKLEAKVLLVEVLNSDILVLFWFINPNWDVKVVLILL